MSRWLIEMKNLRTPLVLVPAVYYILLLVSIALSDPGRPRNLYNYNELAFLPFVVMLTILMGRVEFGGRTMEIISTYPLSYTRLLLRKMAAALASAVLLHAGLMGAYRLRFHTLEALYYPYNGASPGAADAGWLPLLLQALPAYLLLAALTMLGMTLSRKLYGGLAAGFGLWMLSVLAPPGTLGPFVLLTAGLSENMSFPVNRLWLIGASMAAAAAAAVILNRRSRWVVEGETE
ncbi:hypothetical protein MJA45_26805 [Paenibacillus aurantius]|uniref:Uncharacterized protein n=1 Tax=Paenibacillus aurantius TaxID=2918900 RepID=A0AA96LDE6_9BACL|nr:hypothetical protein [Paenibacillus aurantius]WNQ11168.1 hypothetical protein MJA45_26805 [Paenibacillus aurantius]